MVDKKYIKNSEIRFRLLEEMKSLKLELNENGFTEYAETMSKMIAKFRIKYGADLI